MYQELNPSRRFRLHRDLAAALDLARARGSDQRGRGRYPVLPFGLAARGAAGVAPALEAADRAGAAGAHDEQATSYGSLRPALPDDDRRADLLARRAVALGWALRFDDAVTATRAAVEAGSGCAIAADVATVLATAGSNTHAWQLATDTIAYVRRR